MNDLDIAVIIVSYRCAAYTIESLRSLQSERSNLGTRIRAIVVDNASGDAPAIAEAIAINDWADMGDTHRGASQWRFWLWQQPRYRAGVCDRRAVVCLPAQPRCASALGAVAVLARFMEQHPEVGIAGSGFENPDGSEWPIAFRFPTLLSELDAGLGTGFVTRMLRRWVVAQRMSLTSQRVDWVSGASMMLRPQMLRAVGGFDENYFLYFEETDLSRLAGSAGFETWYVPESRVMHFAGQSTKFADPTLGRNRLPAYWYQSRRRYFATAFGVRHAIAIDGVALAASYDRLVEAAAHRAERSRRTVLHPRSGLL